MTNKHAQALGKLGGKRSVASRFAGKTKSQISNQMKMVRYAKYLKTMPEKYYYSVDNNVALDTTNKEVKLSDGTIAPMSEHPEIVATIGKAPSVITKAEYDNIGKD